MITFLALMLFVIVAVIVGLFALGAGGTAILLVFGDVIIGAVLVYFIIRAITKKK